MSKQAKMLLGDDGTLDTVIVCSECGEEFRFTFDGSDCVTAGDSERAYHEFVQWAKREAAEEHECETALSDAQKAGVR